MNERIKQLTMQAAVTINEKKKTNPKQAVLQCSLCKHENGEWMWNCNNCGLIHAGEPTSVPQHSWFEQMGINCVSGIEDYHQKFAELIVQQCCNMFVELRTRPADLAVKDVKKYFGVE